MDGDRYWIVMFDTETGGGVAFVPVSESRARAVELVMANIRYDWPVVEATIIGVTAELAVDGLYRHASGVYHYGGDANI